MYSVTIPIFNTYFMQDDRLYRYLLKTIFSGLLNTFSKFVSRLHFQFKVMDFCVHCHTFM